MKKFCSNWMQSLIAGVAVAGVLGVAYWSFVGLPENPTFSATTQTVANSSSPTTDLAPQLLNITVYRTPTCGCCQGWVEHIKQNGFQVTDIVKPESEIQTIRQKHNLPSDLTSCHTSEIAGYLVEGHIPVADVKRLISQKPNIAGISVPGMPIGTPGMEMGDRQQSFDVFAFKKDGQTRVFNSYKF
ncbi:hypothetical protein AFK68_14690 [Hydrocoleum sp. CS-953]|uniref:DUF411 domain-containing protein n=1 Tax=Hydrocoleum sp. CS-953 TaxID=1671698 RepID=UPI000B9AF4DB|nr:DUF411 domain-containing protein [Hydrocoleum sp. CS-953]OZH53875.1 hypothetical protein AFK68_14690 [Hydrocoleum sp. CS-953]